MKEKTQSQFWIQKGAIVNNEGREFVILAIADLNKVIAQDLQSGEKVLLTMGALGPPREIAKGASAPKRETDILSVSTDLWDVARQRLNWIRPLLASYSTYSQDLAQKIAKEAGVGRATIYRWVNAYRCTCALSSLLPQTSQRGGKGGSRLDPAVETIIKDTLENFYDTEQKVTIEETVLEIRRLCSNANLRLPATGTIRNRIVRTNGRARTKAREGEAAAYAQHDPSKGSIPDADWPLSIVQIDHTLLPVIIVDDVHRKPINRAWITLAIDVFSRVCLGMYLSLDAPSAMSMGMCIAHAILPKDPWLRRLNITTVDWNYWGVMGALHADNAREFRGDMMKVACYEYDIDLHLRPVKKPRYGAHIERLMGTVSQGLKRVGGATFSGTDEKGEYDSEGNACMTFAELEEWLVLFFARYHLQKHDGIGTSPFKKWREGLLGTKQKPGRGLPARRLDEEILRINFTPYVERTVQDYGVVIDDVHYYHDVLRPWINTPHPKFPKHKRLFRFRRDPRDISQVYFFDELSGRYYSIPYRDTSLPPVSIWELRNAQRIAEERGISKKEEKLVFAILDEQRNLEASAAEKTKTARRSQQRRAEHKKQMAAKKETMPSVSEKPAPSTPPPMMWDYDPDEIKGFD